MRIVVLSDSHRQFGPVQKIIEQQPDADFFIHLGDSEGSLDLLPSLYPDKKFYCVSGNCDSDISLPKELVIHASGLHKIFAAHGHRYHVNYTDAVIAEEAVKNGCSIVCYGHTHVRKCTFENGVYILNPGSCACPRDGLPPSYAYIDIVGNNPFINIVSLK